MYSGAHRIHVFLCSHSGKRSRHIKRQPYKNSWQSGRQAIQQNDDYNFLYVQYHYIGYVRQIEIVLLLKNIQGILENSFQSGNFQNLENSPYIKVRGINITVKNLTHL